jgi:steroid 5-alpha reductase family enzyme
MSVFSPALILYFLTKVTGIPMTEALSIESKGEAYRDYQRSTSAFIPWPPKVKNSKLFQS